MSIAKETIMVSVLLLGTVMPGLSQETLAALPAPSNEGFSLPRIGGNLHYALTASESGIFGYNGTSKNVTATSVSGDVAYLSISQLQPFSLVYAGGYSSGISNQPSSTFHNLSVSQILTFGRWTIVGADSLKYLPQSPITGLSGIPGQGDLGVTPVDTGTAYGQGVLNNNGAQLSNTVSGTTSRQLGAANTLNASGSWAIQRFVGNLPNNGTDNNTATGTAVLDHRIDSRNSLNAIYSYSKSTFPDFSTAFVSQAVSVEFSRHWTKKFSTDASIGPQRTTGSFEPTYNLGINASLAYAGKGYSASAAYVQSTNSGAGVTTGSKSKAATANLNRKLGAVWNSSASFAYTRTNGLPTTNAVSFFAQTIVGSGQLSHQLGRNYSMYASYTAERQILGDATVQPGAFSGFSQIVGFGVTYSPRSIKLDH